MVLLTTTNESSEKKKTQIRNKHGKTNAKRDAIVKTERYN